ncbi:DDE_3 domain-containing protein [Trichonephila clavipes]|nr:DDE_3 domain-containing protein [Trichonephila clavipes]
MGDNACSYRPAIVDDFLVNGRIEWLAYSPNLKPIENLWVAFSRTPVPLRDLEYALQEELRLLISAVVDHLVTRMLTR